MNGPILTAKKLSRRTVLRGAGAMMSLPMLEAMATSRCRDESGPEEPMRLLYVYVPNGVKLDEWRQPASGLAAAAQPEGLPVESEPAPFTLPPLAEGLSDLTQDLVILRGLCADKARANGDGPGDHARAAAAYLTGVQPLKTEGRVQLGVSADQVAARQLGHLTRVRSLVLGLEPGRQSGQCDSGYACAYSGHVSWESRTVPAAKEIEPQRAFDRLFRGGDAGMAPGERERRVRERRSVLDYLRQESKALAKGLGAADRARLDEYEAGVRELERRLSFQGSAHVAAVPDSARPEAAGRSGKDGGGMTFKEHAELMGEIVAHAFQADVTRVATLMYGNEGSGRRYTEVGVQEGHHTLSHHGNDPEKLASIGRINRLHLEAFGVLLRRLRAAGAGDGNVMDHSMVVYGSGIAEGNRHDHHDLPILLAAGQASGIGGGRRVEFPKNTPLNNLHLTLLSRLGVTVPGSLGDSTGLLPL